MFGQDTLSEAAIVKAEDLAKFKDAVRTPVELSVTLYAHGYPLAEAKARNIGPEGMFVEAQGLPRSRNTYLEVEFELKDRKGVKLYRLPVYVATSETEGSDLRFVSTYMTAFRYIGADTSGRTDH
jgi:hypothetical protein